MPALIANDCVLLVIDVQGNLARVVDQSESVVQNNVRLINAAKFLEVPVGLTEQNATRLGVTIGELVSLVPSAPVFHKMAFSSTREDGFSLWLNQLASGRTTAVLTGTEAHVCVLQTALGLHEAGWHVAVVDDACGSRTSRNHAAGIARASRAGCDIVTTEMILFEWLGTASNPMFKQVLQLIK